MTHSHSVRSKLRIAFQTFHSSPKLIAGVAGILAVMQTPVSAAEAQHWVPLLDARLRYEAVDQAGFGKDAEAFTGRLRAGLQFTNGDVSILGEAEGTLALSEHYNSTTNGKAAYPVVADPENAELNRLQIQYTGVADTTFTVGRQRINIDDQRFVGSVGWRQNEQTFDAIRMESAAFGPLKADVTYSWSDRTIFGVDSGIQSISGSNVFATLSADVSNVTLTGFAFLVDQAEVGRRQFSSQTYGMRASGKFAFASNAALALAASYAKQADWKDNPNSYKADYWLADATLSLGKIDLNAAYEVLGADTGAANTGFQTPLATLHKFQGWADKFLTTPANGVRDLQGGASYMLGKIGLLGPVKLVGAYHQFDSDIGSSKYGHEWDAQIVMKPRPDMAIIAKFADYKADTFATDTQKIWIEIGYSL